MAQDTTTRQFLDYAGLLKFWQTIVNKFATQNDSVKIGSLSVVDTDTKDITRGISYKNVSGNTTEVLTLPAASREKAGLMSADHFAIIEDFQANIDSTAPFAGLKIDGDEISLKGRKGNIKLEYTTEGESAGRKAYISLIDADYPEGTWTKIDEATYTEGITSGAADGKYIVYNDPEASGEGLVYYMWSKNEAGPVNALGRPLLRKPISQIDVTELVKSGFLISSDVVVNPTGHTEGTYLELKFATGEKGEGIDTVYINVTDLVEVYEAGEGITVTHKNNGVDDIATTGIITLNAATDDKLGGIRTGYKAETNAKIYAVKLDEDCNAYVAVPWDDVEVTISSNDETGGKKYLEVNRTKTSENNVDTFAFTIEVGDGIKDAEKYAKTSIQTVNGDEVYTTASVTNNTDYVKTVQVKLTTDAEESLALADSAVQTITPASNYITSTVSSADLKGQKSYDIDLSTTTKTSLGLADSAVQEITLFGTKLDKNSNIYTVENGKKALTLGTASNSNITTDTTLTAQTSSVDSGSSAVINPTVPTTLAVKTYIDNAILTSDNAQEAAIKTAIERLDSSVNAGTVVNSFNDGTVAQQVYTKVEIVDGILQKVDAYSLKVKDITDFRPLTSTEIDEICSNYI